MNDEITLLAEDCLLRENQVYFLAKNTNILCVLDINTCGIQLLDCMPEESIFESRLCAKVLEWKEELIFIPANANKIWLYRIIDGQWRGIGLGRYAHLKNKIFQAVIYDNILVMIGCSIPAIFRINLLTEQIEIIESPLRDLVLVDREQPYRCSFCRGSIVQIHEKLIIASGISNSVIMYNLSDSHISFWNIGHEGNQYSGIAWDGEYFWLAPRYKTSVVRWDGAQQTFEYELPYEEWKDEIGFWGISSIHGNLILLGKKIYSMVITDECRNIVMKKLPKAFLMLKEKDACICSIDLNGELVIENHSVRKTFHLSVNKNDLREFQLRRINNCKIEIPRDETSDFKINDYLENIGYIRKVDPIERKENIGSNIWSKIKKYG